MSGDGGDDCDLSVGSEGGLGFSGRGTAVSYGSGEGENSLLWGGAGCESSVLDGGGEECLRVGFVGSAFIHNPY